MNINKARAIAIFAALGVTAAEKWNDTRMNAKLAKLGEMIDEDTKLEGQVKEDADAVLAANEAGTKVTVGDAEEAKPKGKKPAPKKTKPEPEPEESGEAGGDTDEKEEQKPAPKKGEAKKAEKAPEPKGPPGVRETRTRPFLAGCIIKEHGGLVAGVTDEMVKELDERYGKANPAESLFCLRNAWHAIRGSQTGDPEKE